MCECVCGFKTCMCIYIYTHTYICMYLRASQVALVVRNPLANAGEIRNGFDPWVGTIRWRRAWQPTPVFLPKESHGQRSLAGYGP